LIVAADTASRVQALLTDYARRFERDFYATAPLPDRPSN
jgi:hypothetical protein